MFNLKLFDEEVLSPDDGSSVGHHSSLSGLSLPLQVSIGEIQMSLSEVLKLEAGAEVRIKLSESSLITFLLGGEPLASATMSIEEEEIIFQIKEVFLNQESEKSDNQLEAQSEQELITG